MAAATTTPTPSPVHEASGIKSDSPMGLLLNDLGAIVAEAQHGEMWGVTLKDINDVPTTIVLEKFLRANDNNFDAARKQLVEALQWREKTNPIKVTALHSLLPRNSIFWSRCLNCSLE